MPNGVYDNLDRGVKHMSIANLYINAINRQINKCHIILELGYRGIDGIDDKCL